MRPLLAALALIAAATSVQAHQLSVFAFVEAGEVVVESRFSNGSVPVSGEVRVMDAAEALLTTLPLEKDGTARFALDADVAGDGLVILVDTGEGHEDYWILTPDDIARGSGPADRGASR